MKIVIDLLGNQSSGSRNRGIGRYSLAITKSILTHKKGHKIHVVISSLFLDVVQTIKDELKGYINEDDIFIWDAPENVSHINIDNDSRRLNAELIRENFIYSLTPDLVLVTSLFEGLVDDAVVTVKKLNKSIPTAVILYDLIPLINSSPYLDNPLVKRWYDDKIDNLKRADLLLSISESSKIEALEYLDFSKENVVNISTASDEQFKKINISPEHKKVILDKFDLSNDFLMYTGGIDYRKNIEGLINAYALLNQDVRAVHQLAIVCSISEEQKRYLKLHCSTVGLSENEVVFTGFISEDDLIALYNLCKAFIFPSWHEGFGLPALEAMNCGAPTIVSNRSSLPEVVGLEESLFDPFSVTGMSDIIEKVLCDFDFRNRLIAHGSKQIKEFSWDKCGKLAIEALESIYERHQVKREEVLSLKPKLAYVSPLPPQRSGIADYSAELVPQLLGYYDIDLIASDNTNISIPNTAIRSIQWFENNFDQYDRVLYHFGNSHFHSHMFELLKKIPGTVVLHDFFLGHVNEFIGCLSRELYYSHGYKSLINDFSRAVWNYPANKRVIDHSNGVIVHSDYSKKLAEEWYGEHIVDNWTIIPLLRIPAQDISKGKSRDMLGIPEDAFLVCSFGMLGETKQNFELLESWLNSDLSEQDNSFLVFVGENEAGDYGRKLTDAIKRSNCSSRIKITGWTSISDFNYYLRSADIAVQLRTRSRGETSAAVLDCMKFGLPTIVNRNGTMQDIDESGVIKIDDKFSNSELTAALERLSKNEDDRRKLSKRAKFILDSEHAPQTCAKKYFDAIESFYDQEDFKHPNFIDALIQNVEQQEEFIGIANSIALNNPDRGQNNLFVDISQLITVDSNSGIQRVVKSILKNLLENPPRGYRVEPVYATVQETGYRYARKYTCEFLNCSDTNMPDSVIDFKKGDVFLGLDLAQHVVIAQNQYYQKLRAFGVKTYFVIYDLLPILKSRYFPQEWELTAIHNQWLGVIAQNSGGICISRAVAEEYRTWLVQNKVDTSGFDVNWFHLGADFDYANASFGLPGDFEKELYKIKSNLSFLIVGTIEPRKGIEQTLDAFEQLWSDGSQVNLVLVGKEGWLVERLVSRLKNHPERDSRLFWIEEASDEYLKKIYAECACLIAASEAEGFGLPLIEAAQNKLPIIARDIAVFREVAGNCAEYFADTKEPAVIVNCVVKWLEKRKQNLHVQSSSLTYNSWEQSTHDLCVSINILTQ